MGSGVITACKLEVSDNSESWIEVELIKGDIAEVADLSGCTEEEDHCIVNEAFGKPLTIDHVAKGMGMYGHCLLFKVDEKDDIKNCQVSKKKMRKETGYSINATTAQSTTVNEHSASRVFVPFDSLGGEDYVCGSAHALLGLYWATKQAIFDGEEIRAIHVGRRGGGLRIFLVLVIILLDRANFSFDQY
ncbi:hypothetical protein F5876DRAFT_62319 [Lentinula aff. lateritia]|uniref:Uncharacterized protein n=1 Tax=Lentinula aff. lateritia TaxID=2804960 RepID=A0ACC1UBM5_9AGAR|nr:hypothetical protein F5876DRAFT_62319 [Lentinula aff. lateritia]